MQYLDRLLDLAGAKGSLRKRIRTFFITLAAILLIPAVLSLSLLLVFSNRYHGIVAHIEGVSSLRPMVQDSLLASVLEIVVGRARFEDGAPTAALNGIEARLDQLIRNDAASRGDLEVARRVLDTLSRYVDQLGEQIASHSAVDENFALNGEIKNLATLFFDMLQAAIDTEIQSAASISRRIQAVLLWTLAMAAGILAFALVFAGIAQAALLRSVQTQLERLESFAKQIAGGELEDRAPPPEVDELRLLTDSLNTMAFRLKRLIDENRREQENLMIAELRTLQAQITPHFLYNTLDAIVWLAESNETAEVINITRALSSFFRTSLAGGREWITIGEELEHLDGYMTIQRIRYRDILKFQLTADEGLDSCQIPKLLIQPLVENAIYHGIKNRRGGGLVTVEMRKRGERLHVAVTDTGAGMPEETYQRLSDMLKSHVSQGYGHGFGLYSVDKRIKLYYSQPEGLAITSAVGAGTTVRFDVPVTRPVPKRSAPEETDDGQ
ncbi:MAG: sensor histidine kinase [Oscillospiraceae bacterium]|jgi:two-component system sensor histidine kinase YesM|nr:sensor histidine kinase [Oscillospiraceae bacterium]